MLQEAVVETLQAEAAVETVQAEAVVKTLQAEAMVKPLQAEAVVKPLKAEAVVKTPVDVYMTPAFRAARALTLMKAAVAAAASTKSQHSTAASRLAHSPPQLSESGAQAAVQVCPFTSLESVGRTRRTCNSLRCLSALKNSCSALARIPQNCIDLLSVSAVADLLESEKLSADLKSVHNRSDPGG